MRRAIIALSLALTGCSMATDTHLAAEAVPKFHELMDSGQYDAIYATGSEALKSTNTPEKFAAVIGAIHRKLGPTKSSKQTGWNVRYRTEGTAVVLTYATVFAEGDGVETFTYRLKGDKALLEGYNIKSEALVLK